MSLNVDKAARLLIEARRSGTKVAVEQLDGDVVPADADDGYKVQHRTLSLLGLPVAGWKIGATSPAIMEKFGLKEPMYGAILAEDVHASGARIAASRYPARTIETEFAYRLGRDVAVGGQAPSRRELLDAVDAIVPVFEIINPRLDRIPYDCVALATADCGLNGGLVTGEPVGDWQGLDLARHQVRLHVDGVLKGEGTGAEALGDPANVLEWVAAKLWASGVGLKVGQLVSTGTCTGVVPIGPNAHAIGDFGPLGRVELRFV